MGRNKTFNLKAYSIVRDMYPKYGAPKTVEALREAGINTTRGSVYNLARKLGVKAYGTRKELTRERLNNLLKQYEGMWLTRKDIEDEMGMNETYTRKWLAQERKENVNLRHRINESENGIFRREYQYQEGK